MSLTQEMKDEGNVRSVINRMQKLKKKAKLVPTDEVTIFYQVNPGYLSDIIKSNLEKIGTSCRATVAPGACPMSVDSLADEKEVVKGEFLPGTTILNIQVAYGSIDPNAPQKPAMKCHTANGATILQENPRGVAACSVYAAGDGGPTVETKFVNLQLGCSHGIEHIGYDIRCNAMQF